MIEVGSEDTGTRDDTASSVSTGTERLVLWSGSVAAFPFRSVRAKKKERENCKYDREIVFHCHPGAREFVRYLINSIPSNSSTAADLGGSRKRPLIIRPKSGVVRLNRKLFLPMRIAQMLGLECE